MISGAENQTLYGEWSKAIEDPDARDGRLVSGASEVRWNRTVDANAIVA